MQELTLTDSRKYRTPFVNSPSPTPSVIDSPSYSASPSASFSPSPSFNGSEYGQALHSPSNIKNTTIIVDEDSDDQSSDSTDFTNNVGYVLAGFVFTLTCVALCKAFINSHGVNKVMSAAAGAMADTITYMATSSGYEEGNAHPIQPDGTQTYIADSGMAGALPDELPHTV